MRPLFGRRVMLRPLNRDDFQAWRETRGRNRARLAVWEPKAVVGASDTVTDPVAFSNLCSARQREREHDLSYGFGVFVAGGFCGEMNLSSVQRGPLQSCHVGYWIDEAVTGNGYAPEAFVVVTQFAFETLRLHRLQVSIVPRNTASLRVVEKLGLRNEGLAKRYFQVNGVWEDHYRFAITVEEWLYRAHELLTAWVNPVRVTAQPLMSTTVSDRVAAPFASGSRAVGGFPR